MDQAKFNTIFQKLKMIFDVNQITILAKETTFCQRIRQIKPFELLTSLVTAMASGTIESCADLQRRFNEWTGLTVSYRSWYNQLSKSAFAQFMREVVCHLLNACKEKVLDFPKKHEFSEFKRIIIQDGSSFSLKDQLCKVFPGRFTTISPAAVELHATMDLLADQPCQIVLTPDTYGEREYLPDVASLAGCLSLLDRGYFDLRWFHALDQAHGNFIARAKESVNPIVESALREDGKKLPGVAGEYLKDALAFDKFPKRQRSDLDVMWRVGKQEIRFRLILWWNKKEKRYSYLITNLPRDRFNVESVSTAYRLRWQVELMFKEWKSYANLRRFDTENPDLAEGLIWASIAAAIYKRFIAHAAQKVHGVEISTRKVAMSCAHLFTELTESLLLQKRTMMRTRLEKLLYFLARNTKRAHPKRDRKTGRLALGLQPVAGS